MIIQSTRFTSKRKKGRDSWSVPKWISKPRSAVSSANNLLQTADSLHWFKNPIPAPAQKFMTGLGAGFAALNVGAELIDGDYEGALWDTGNSIASLAGGARLCGLSQTGVDAMFGVGVVLNSALAIKQFRQGDTTDACLRLGSVAGLALSLSGSIVGGSLGTTLGHCGVALRGVVGIAGMIYDLTDRNGYLNRPDRFN